MPCSTSTGAIPSAGNLAVFLALKTGGGILLGVVAAWLTSSLMRLVDAYQVDILLTLTLTLTLALALGGYALADTLHISAPLEAVAAAISLRRFNKRPSPMPIAHESIDHFWEVIDEVQNAVLFVLLGLEILAIPFHKLSLEAGLVAIAAVNFVRLAVVALLLALIRLFHRSHQSSLLILSWGGLRGGLSIALSVPATQGRSWILATTYIVVVFSIVFQGGSLDVVLRRRHKELAQYS